MKDKYKYSKNSVITPVMGEYELAGRLNGWPDVDDQGEDGDEQAARAGAAQRQRLQMTIYQLVLNLNIYLINKVRGNAHWISS